MLFSVSEGREVSDFGDRIGVNILLQGSNDEVYPEKATQLKQRFGQ